jgi:glutaredoxin 3
LKFFVDNWHLFLVALVSGGLLLWPVLRKGGGGAGAVGTGEAVRQINREKGVLVDVSEPGEYATGHASGARNVPLGQLEGSKDLPSNKALPLLVMCPTGARRPCGRAAAQGRLRKGRGRDRRHRRLARGPAAHLQSRRENRLSRRPGIHPRTPTTEGPRMTAVKMYTTQVCPYCVRAKALLKQRGVEQIDEIRIDLDPAQRDHMVALTGRRTVPQIFIGDTHVGGCDDLVALDQRGALLPLLGR